MNTKLILSLSVLDARGESQVFLGEVDLATIVCVCVCITFKQTLEASHCHNVNRSNHKSRHDRLVNVTMVDWIHIISVKQVNK